MLRKLRSRLTYANVVATLALFVAVGTGGAYAANTVFSADIVDGEVKSIDIGQNEIGSADVKDNSINTFDVHSFIGDDVIDNTLTGDDIKDASLHDEDLGDGALFLVSIGSVAATSCVSKNVPASQFPVDQRDHVVLTPWLDAADGLVYDVRNAPSNTVIHACNFGTATVDDGFTTFTIMKVLD